jgi:hypothetical protein
MAEGPDAVIEGGTVIGAATGGDPQCPGEGVETVQVDGVAVRTKGRAKGASPGQVWMRRMSRGR